MNGTVTWFVYDLMKGLPDMIGEYDDGGTLIAGYTHGPSVDEIISMRRGGGSYFYQTDGLGSITSLNDNTEAAVNTYVYDSFGHVVNKAEAVANPYGFTGRVLDSESGLMYYRTRYYDASIGRFISADPIGFIGGINFYAYCLNDPVNFIDPFGLEFSDILPGIRTAIVEGAKGGTYSVGEAAKATSDIAMNGHPLAQTALGIAIVSEVVPLAGAVAISAFPTATSAVLNLAPYSASIIDFTYGFLTETAPPQGWGYLSSGAMFIYQQIKDSIADKNSGPCENK